MVRLFVYGTLRRGEANHHRLAQSTFVGEARTRPEFRLVDLGAFPGLLAEGSTAVVGEVYDVPDGEIPAVDAFEDPDVYSRTSVTLSDGSAAEAYVLRPGRLEARGEIAGGDWRGRF